jgi:hypothetical protein
LKQLSRHLNPATVLSCIALFVALSGAAYAAGIGKKSVKTQHLGNGSVTTLKLRGGAVTTPKLRNLAVTTAKLRNLAVSNPKLGDAAVTSTKLANGAVRSAALGGQVVTTGKLKNGGVTEEKLANNVVGTEKLTANAVATGKVQDGAVSAAKLNSGLLAQLVKNVTYETKTSTLTASETPKEATVECPGGKVAIGGGAKVIGGTTVALTDSGPTPPNADGKRIGWSAAAAEMVADAGNWSVEVYVVCAEL